MLLDQKQDLSAFVQLQKAWISNSFKKFMDEKEIAWKFLQRNQFYNYVQEFAKEKILRRKTRYPKICIEGLCVIVWDKYFELIPEPERRVFGVYRAVYLEPTPEIFDEFF